MIDEQDELPFQALEASEEQCGLLVKGECGSLRKSNAEFLENNAEPLLKCLFWRARLLMGAQIAENHLVGGLPKQLDRQPTQFRRFADAGSPPDDHQFFTACGSKQSLEFFLPERAINQVSDIGKKRPGELPLLIVLSLSIQLHQVEQKLCPLGISS